MHYHVRQGAAAAVPGGDAGQVAGDFRSARALAQEDMDALEECGYVLQSEAPSLDSGITPAYVRWYLEIPERYGAAQIVEIERCQEECL